METVVALLYTAPIASVHPNKSALMPGTHLHYYCCILCTETSIAPEPKLGFEAWTLITKIHCQAMLMNTLQEQGIYNEDKYGPLVLSSKLTIFEL